TNPIMRALAIRILRRHDLTGSDAEYAPRILALAHDPSPEIRREVLLTIRTLKSDAADGALAEIAATYDGTDRYQLEAVNIAADDRKAALLARLEKSGPLKVEQFPLVQVLDPKRAAEMVLA